jgi:hypothetical protein
VELSPKTAARQSLSAGLNNMSRSHEIEYFAILRQPVNCDVAPGLDTGKDSEHEGGLSSQKVILPADVKVGVIAVPANQDSPAVYAFDFTLNWLLAR